MRCNALIFLQRLKNDRSGLVVMPEFSKTSLCRSVGHGQRHPTSIYSKVPPDAANCISRDFVNIHFYNMDGCVTDH